MSLTTELAKPSSPITQYLRFVGALVADTGRGTPWAEPCKRLLGLDALPGSTTVPLVHGADAGMVGTAFDYRLRFHFTPCRVKDFVAWQGAALLRRLDPSTEPALARFFSNLDILATKLSPAGQVLEEDDERLLSTYCISLPRSSRCIAHGVDGCHIYHQQRREGLVPEKSPCCSSRRTL